MNLSDWQNVAACARARGERTWKDRHAATLAILTSAAQAIEQWKASRNGAPRCVILDGDTGPDGPTAYVACLASYNAGVLYGRYIDLEQCQDVGDIQAGIDWILAHSPTVGAEEYAIHDWENVPGVLSRSEWPDWAEVMKYVEALEEIGSDNAEAYSGYCDHVGQIVSAEDFQDAHCATLAYHEDGSDYAAQFYDEIGAELGPLEHHIDWRSVWRDMTFDGYFMIGQHVFRSV